MNDRIKARWYFDVVSPYAYLHLQRFDDDPRMFESGEMQRAAQVEIGATRKEVR